MAVDLPQDCEQRYDWRQAAHRLVRYFKPFARHRLGNLFFLVLVLVVAAIPGVFGRQLDLRVRPQPT